MLEQFAYFWPHEAVARSRQLTILPLQPLHRYKPRQYWGFAMRVIHYTWATQPTFASTV